jgi:uncharacterized membrane protein YgdD (TMEM256/DUF423 family)
MTQPNVTATEERLPPARMVRWVLLAGVILFSVGLYFRVGLHVQPLGTVPATTPTP